jgi:catechol 2,3-dioxygenase-like lactoylglutathione lyase family enzyme
MEIAMTDGIATIDESKRPDVAATGIMKGLNGLHHVAMTVPDIDLALAFYNGVLGFPIAMCLDVDETSPDASDETLWLAEKLKGLHQIDVTEKVDVSIRMVHANNALIEFWQFRSPCGEPQDPMRPTRFGGYMHIALDVTNLDEIYPKLEAAGVKFMAPPLRLPDAATLYARDPFGNIIEFQELSDSSSIALGFLRRG